jgi:hypothetical protein
VTQRWLLVRYFALVPYARGALLFRLRELARRAIERGPAKSDSAAGWCGPASWAGSNVGRMMCEPHSWIGTCFRYGLFPPSVAGFGTAFILANWRGIHQIYGVPIMECDEYRAKAIDFLTMANERAQGADRFGHLGPTACGTGRRGRRLILPSSLEATDRATVAPSGRDQRCPGRKS